MQTQVKSWFLALLACFLMVGAGKEAQARKDRTLCGVDVSYQYRCWKELRRLVSACRTTPVICGRSYQDGTMPRFRTVRARCKQMYRSQRRRWSEGLCGIRLFSRPSTYCGLRGVQVAVACIKQRNKNIQPIQPAVGGMRAKTSTPRTPVARTNPKPRPALRDAAPTPVTAAAATTRERPAVGQHQSSASSTPATSVQTGQGTSIWLYLLQFLTLGLVLMLLFRRERSSSRTWEQRTSRWNEMDSSWGMSLEQDNDTDLSRVENSLDQIELRLQVWEEQWREAQSNSDPIASLQQWADAVHAYYTKIAEVIAKNRGQQVLSDVQNRLLEARDKLRWMFQAHREPLPQASTIEQLQIDLLSRTDDLLQQTGYVGEEQQIAVLLTQGQFSVDEFLARKAEDQAHRFLQEEPLQNFSAIRNEFLQRLEQLYRSNLDSLAQAGDAHHVVDMSEQNQIFLEKYVLGFLLSDLPSQFERYSHQSNRERSGALADQILQFIEDELTSTGLELFPVFEKSEFMSAHARFLYMARAGVRMIGQHDVILREADASLLEVRPQTESVIQQPVSRELLDDIVQATAEYSSQSPEMLSMDRMIGVAVAEPVGVPEHTAAYSQDLLGDIDEITMSHSNPSQAEEHIGNPDSDPPTSEATTDLHISVVSEKLPAGPLPFIDASQHQESSPKRGKTTREYGPMAADSELPYTLNQNHPSKN